MATEIEFATDNFKNASGFSFYASNFQNDSLFVVPVAKAINLQMSPQLRHIVNTQRS